MGPSTLWECVATLSAFLVSCSRITDVHGYAVMSVDISSEWMRVVALSSSVPMERAISNEFMGKIATAIAFDNGERLIGEDALESGVYRPSDCYVYFLDLIGKKIDNPVVQQYKKRFPQYNIVPHPKRNTVLFKRSDSNELFSPEDLVAMLLEEAKDLAKYLTKEDVKEVVISVPSYFGQSERFGMILAAKIAKIEVLQLINSCTAAALNYGTFHVDTFYKTVPIYMMIFDMDSYGTQTSIVSYQLVKSEDKTVTEFQPQLTVLGVSYERSLGGLEIQLRLRDYLASKFNSLKLTSNDVSKDPKSMARLFIEAGRLKGALSTNTEQLVRVKNLIDKKDLEIKVTREELDELCNDIFDQVVFTARKALRSSGLIAELIEQVILIGTATEVLRVQERLVKDLKLSRTLNTDGAVVLGAAYKAADCIRPYKKGFEVKPFITKDATLFSVQITFDEEGFDDSNTPKPVKRIFLGRMNPYPQHHFITFDKHQRDIAFSMGYVELNHLDPNEIKSLGSLSLAKFKTKGIQEAYIKYQGQEAVDIKGIEVGISIDDSGLLGPPRVNLLVEKTVTEDKTDSVSDSKNPKVSTVKEAIRVYITEISFMNVIQDQELQTLINKLKKIKNIDLAIAQKRKSLHNLLEAIYDTRFSLNKPEYASALTDTEKKSILNKSIELSNWLASGGTDAEEGELDSKYDELQKLVTPVWTRVKEHSERPLKLEALNNALDRSNLLLKDIKMIKLDDVPFTQIEIDTFEKLIVETTSWRDDLVKKQEKHPKNVDPVLKIKKIEMMRSFLEIELSKLTSLKLRIKESLKDAENLETKTTKLQTDDEKDKMIKKENSDDIGKTLTLHNDRVVEVDKNKGNVTIEDNVNLDNQIKAYETWLGWFHHLIEKTSQSDEL